MEEFIDATVFGLSSRTKIIKKGKGYYRIIKKRKSRIIMKDGQQLLEIANSIWNKEKNAKVDLLISGPICGKTIAFLEQNSIEIIHEK